MNRMIAIIVGIALLLLLVLQSMTYTVSYHQVAVKSTLGRDPGVVRDAGLRAKLPFFFDRVTHFDTRLQLVDTPEEEVQLADNSSVVLQAFLLWKVETDSDEGAIDFFEGYGQSMDNAQRKLESHLRSAMKSTLGRYSFDDLIGAEGQLADAEAAILADLQLRPLRGVQPVRVGISQLTLPPKTTQFVLNRMKATRKVLADAERSKGESTAASILSNANTVADRIRSFAGQRAEQIKAEASEMQGEMLAQMNQASDLAIFLYWLDAYRQTLRDNATFILTRDIPPFHLSDLGLPLNGNGVPMPASMEPALTGQPSPTPVAQNPDQTQGN